MARIKIEDLPVLEDLSPKETKGIFGGEVTPNLVAGGELFTTVLKSDRKIMPGEFSDYKITPAEITGIDERYEGTGEGDLGEFDGSDVGKR